MSTSPPAGWYPDPRVPHRERFWDGGGWTDSVRELQPPLSAPVARVLATMRTLWPLFAVGAVAALVACVVGVVASPFAEREVARADGPVLELPGGETSLTLYGAAADPERVDCDVAPEGRTSVGGLVLSTRVVDGTELDGLARVRRGWADGAVVSCPGATRLVAIAGSRNEQVGFVALTGLMTVLGGAFAAVGAASARARG